MQTTESSAGTRRFGIFEVDLRAAEMRKHGVRIKLQDQPFRILTLLLNRPGELVTREQLRGELWQNHTFVDFDRSLNKAMAKLRSALGDSAECPRYIETIPRHGYRFLLPVDSAPEPMRINHGAGHSLPWTEETTPSQAPADQPAKELVRPAQIFYSLAGGGGLSLLLGVLVTLVALAFLFSLQFKPSASSAASTGAVSPRRSIAVLGFQNLSGDAGGSWLSTAISEWLSTELSAGEQLRTVPAESIARMKMELALPDADKLGHDSLARIRKNLGTDLVVVGSYAILADQPEGQVRLDLRLLDTRTGDTVDATSETGLKSSLFDLVSHAGAHLRARLGIRQVTLREAAEVATSLPSNAEATRYYAEGLTKLRVFDDLSARDLFLKAVTVEPNSALVHAALATTWADLGYDRNASLEAKKAFDLSSNLSRAERLLVEGRYRQMSSEWEKAIEIYQALFKFFPDDPEYGLALANAQLKANRWKDALETIAALRALPPPAGVDPRIDLAEGDAARSLGDMKKAEESKARAAERAQAIGASLLVARARLDQAWLYENLGRLKDVDFVVLEARNLYSAAHDRQGVARTNTIEAIALTFRGDYVAAQKKYEDSLAAQMETGNKSGTASVYDDLGDLYFFLGDLAAAKNGYQHALSAYRELNDENGIALVKIGLGQTLLAEGKYAEAQRLFEEALSTCRRIGNPSREAGALLGLGQIQRERGDLDASWKTEMQAQQIFEQVGDRASEAESHLELAKLLLDQGKYPQAESWAMRAATVSQRTSAERDAAAANIILARSLFGQRKFTQAKLTLDSAMQFVNRSHDLQLHLLAEITAAQLRSLTDEPPAAEEPANRLNVVVADASAGGFIPLSLEAELALAEIELKSQHEAVGRSHLEGLERKASREGFDLIAKKAAADLQKLAVHASF